MVFKDGLTHTYKNFNKLKIEKPEFFVGDDLIVPQDYIFYLGDNRGQSLDSSTEGPVTKSKVIGRVSMVIPYEQSFIEYFFKEFIKLFN